MLQAVRIIFIVCVRHSALVKYGHATVLVLNWPCFSHFLRGFLRDSKKVTFVQRVQRYELSTFLCRVLNNCFLVRSVDENVFK